MRNFIESICIYTLDYTLKEIVNELSEVLQSSSRNLTKVEQKLIKSLSENGIVISNLSSLKEGNNNIKLDSEICSLNCISLRKEEISRELGQIKEKYINDIDSYINGKSRNELNSEERSTIINMLNDLKKEMMEKIKNLLKIDLVGLYLFDDPEKFLLEDEHSFLYVCNGPRHFLTENTVREQLRNALHEVKVQSKKNGNGVQQYIYECPSDSEEGGVDAILGLKNILPDINGFILLDEYGDLRELSYEEIEATCSIFYDEIKNIIAVKNDLLGKEEVAKVVSRESIDELTGLGNRKEAYKIVKDIFERIYRDKEECYKVSIGFFDLDDFKSVNDIYGHEVGDNTLVSFSKILQKGRENDVPIRWGGEEFLMINEQLDLEGALNAFENKRKEIQDFSFSAKGNHGNIFYRTSSIGVTEIHKEEVYLMKGIVKQLSEKIYENNLKYDNNSLYFIATTIKEIIDNNGDIKVKYGEVENIILEKDTMYDRLEKVISWIFEEKVGEFIKIDELEYQIFKVFFENIITRADEASYYSKTHGKNKVTVMEYMSKNHYDSLSKKKDAITPGSR